MAKYFVATARPVLRVRNAENRNRRRLAKRLRRVTHDLSQVVRVDLPNGTVEIYRASDVTRHTVKRDAQREAKRTGAKFRTV